MSDTTVTTTADAPSTDAVLLSARRSSDGYWLVGDGVTARFGHGPTLPDALTDWHDALREIAELTEPLGPPIAGEAAWARAILNHQHMNLPPTDPQRRSRPNPEAPDE
jgi:hypothetical protein